MEDNKDVQVTEETKVEETTQKTYTQEDIDNSYKAGIKNGKKELMKNDETYQQFLEWKKTNQNDSEKIAELQANNEQLIKENATLKATNTVAKSDVKPEFLEFVVSKVMSMVDETTDFDTALKNYKKESPQFFGETQIKKVQSSPNLNGGDNQPQTTNSIMNDILRGVKNNS